MAISAAVLGALKVALKTAAKKVATEAGKAALKEGTKQAVSAAAKQALKEVGQKAMTDAQALLLNRLKTAPSKVLYDFASKELGVDVKTVRKVMKEFNQSAKMKEISKGVKFKEAVFSRLKKELGVSDITGKYKGVKRKADNIKDIIRKVEEKNARGKTDDGGNKGDGDGVTDYGASVASRLQEFQAEFDAKLHGLAGDSVDEMKVSMKWDFDFTGLQIDGEKYTQETLDALDVAIDNLVLDAERYESGGDELFITKSDNNEWGVYAQNDIKEWVDLQHGRISHILLKTRSK